jgi:hypothetical protein
MKLKGIKKTSLAISKKWQRFSLGILALFLFLALIIILALSSSLFNEKVGLFSTNNILNLEKEKNINNIKSSQCEDCYINPLTGLEQERDFGFPIAVVIDNHIDARPPASLSKAQIVYELSVEGSITRYLAIYDSEQEIDKLGPVRSARPYMLDLVQELSALFVHVGGSPQALVNIAKDNIFNLNEFYYGDFFNRNENRPKPHNVFIEFENIKKYLKTQNKKTPKITTWNFKEDSEKIKINSNANNLNTNIKIDFGADAYEVKWVYDFKNNNYLRSLNNKVHVDDRNIDIKATNVIIHKTNSEVLDEKLRLRVDIIGEGEAVICFEAVCREGSWEKDSAKTRTRYYIEDKEVEFSPGNFWIEVLDQNDELIY